MSPAVKQQVRERAGHRCEYCLLQQKFEPHRPFHVEHVIAIKHQGSDDLGNLAFACRLCNLLKGPNLSGIDPDTGAMTRLFHPRNDEWLTHFRIDGPRITGVTAIGRTTVWLLEMNTEDRVELRGMLILLGEWP